MANAATLPTSNAPQVQSVQRQDTAPDPDLPTYDKSRTDQLVDPSRQEAYELSTVRNAVSQSYPPHGQPDLERQKESGPNPLGPPNVQSLVNGTQLPPPYPTS